MTIAGRLALDEPFVANDKTHGQSRSAFSLEKRSGIGADLKKGS
jgi:hypothetical protein